ncbi:hypothetical protein [Limosilactobacillus reuteri]|uniref:hypothetical protein n=1 Tax=Limosilactobacillus reuteri TaxID=1598 RepID=UPI00232BDB34|nr:hypothetical protein [Limosilactobacillus reuteri]
MDKQLKKNFMFAFIAQAISFLVSMSTNLVLPKVMSPTEFSYWQLFIFYSLYIPALALGLNDGIYLRYGGALKDKLEYSSIKSQYIFGIFYQLILAIIIGGVLLYFSHTAKRRIVIFMVLIYYMVYTCHNFLGYLFQAVNETNIYSKSIIIHRIFFLLSQLFLILLLCKNVFFYIQFYIIAIGLALLYLLFKIHPFFKNIAFNFELGKKEVWISIKVGISLMIANVCSTLVLGVGRQIIDMHWGLLTFGKISFSLTLINFALTFISQIGLVLFPALRRLDKDNLQKYYKKLTLGLFYLLPLMYIFYLPLQFILRYWLPEYSKSIDYLSIILPICFFDGKMNLIGNTFFKVLNKQVMLLKINIVAIIFAGVWGIIGAYILNNVTFVVIGMVITIMLRSILADIILSNDIHIKIRHLELMDIVLAGVFMIISNAMTWYSALVIIVGIYIVRSLYIFFYEKRWRKL